MEWERACILGAHVGAMERQLEECVAYARTRKQFGQPIGKFQSVSSGTLYSGTSDIQRNMIARYLGL